MASSLNSSYAVSRVRHSNAIRDRNGTPLACGQGYIHLAAAVEDAIVVLDGNYNPDALELLFTVFSSYKQSRLFPGYEDIGGPLQRVFRGARNAAKCFNSHSAQPSKKRPPSVPLGRKTRLKARNASQDTGADQNDAPAAPAVQAHDLGLPNAYPVLAPRALGSPIQQPPAPALPPPAPAMMVPQVFALAEPLNVAAGTEVVFLGIDPAGSAYYGLVFSGAQVAIAPLPYVPVA